MVPTNDDLPEGMGRMRRVAGSQIPDEAGDFVPIQPNPYIVGNPVRGSAMFFGREAEFDLVRERFTSSERGNLLVFCGERRSGKTSILFQLLDRRLGDEFIPVLVDMQSMAISNQQDFLSKVVEAVLEALGPTTPIPAPDFAASPNPANTFQRFIAAVLRSCPGKKLILLFDEYELLESKIDVGILDPEVLLVLASLMEHYPLFLIFTGSQHVEKRKREYWKILGKSVYKCVSYLERDDALALMCKPVEGRVDYEDEALETIHRLTSGQPFYTQAICQNLVDLLNETRTRHVRRDTVLEVVDQLIDNPLPQMIFLWDALTHDEKLTMALLAEVLATEFDVATEQQLSRTLVRRRYPLDLDTPRIATALEKLFKDELLLKNEPAAAPAYAFRMDLWRLWIRRMHSVWQVMREEGMDIRGTGLRRSRQRRLLALGGGALILAALAIGVSRLALPPVPDPVPTGLGLRAAFTLRATPANAQILLNRRPVAVGTYSDSIIPGREQLFAVSAAGYAETTLAINLGPGQTEEATVDLRPLFGDLRVETNPSGAEVRVDGKAQGRSPVVVPGLRVVEQHRVEAALPGHEPVGVETGVRSDSLVVVSLALDVATTNLVVTSEPPNAEVFVDGERRGRAPLRMATLAVGRHRIAAELPGHVRADTTLDVDTRTGQVHMALRSEPPGVLVIQGDHPAAIFIDDVLVRENVQNSGPQSLRGGRHNIRVVLLSGEVVEDQVEIRAREQLVYDYTQRKLSPAARP